MKAPRLFISGRKGVIVLFALALMTSLLLPGVVRANHDPNLATEMWAGKGEFHYLGQTLNANDGDGVDTVSLPADTYFITITEKVNLRHNVEFKLIGSKTVFSSGTIKPGGIITLEVTLTPGTWLVVCKPHRQHGAYFYLEVT